MSDFLHSLRSNKDKRFDRNRRNFDSPSYRSNDRQNGMDRKKKGSYRAQQAEQAQAYAAINKLLPTMKTLLETLTEDRKRLIQAEERKADAMEAIASFLKNFSGAADTPPVIDSIESLCEDGICAPIDDPSSKKEVPDNIPPVDPVVASKKQTKDLQTQTKNSPNDDERLETIKRLRKEGFSYEKIARYLEDNGVPTISGRGKWRGQAVSKLIQ